MGQVKRKRVITKEEKIQEALREIKYTCQNCGNKRIIIPKKDRGICPYCGHLVFKTPLEWFSYYLKRAIAIKEMENEDFKR